MEQANVNRLPDAVFNAVKDFSEKVRANTTKTAEGKNEYYTTNAKKNEYDTKAGDHVEEYLFSLRNHQQEEIQFSLSKNGIMRNATYLDWENAEGRGPKKKEFLGKDIDKLDGIVRDGGLKNMAAEMNWDMAPSKEQEAEEPER